MFAVLLFKDALCFDEAMISDTKRFFFCFCQSTHFQVLHYAQKYFKKKDLYKAQNAYNASRYRGKKVEEERERLKGGGNWCCGEAEKKRGVKGQRG